MAVWVNSGTVSRRLSSHPNDPLQFKALKDGDRFFFTHTEGSNPNPFTPDQLTNIKVHLILCMPCTLIMSLILIFIGFLITGTQLLFQARSLGDILCDNTAIGDLRTDVFVSSSKLFKCHQRSQQSQLDVSLYYPHVDCTWNTWSEWGACSKTCDGGNKTRTRTQNAPLYGGQECSGSATSSTECNTNNCPGGEK